MCYERLMYVQFTFRAWGKFDSDSKNEVLVRIAVLRIQAILRSMSTVKFCTCMQTIRRLFTKAACKFRVFRVWKCSKFLKNDIMSWDCTQKACKVSSVLMKVHKCRYENFRIYSSSYFKKNPSKQIPLKFCISYP